MGEIQRWWKSIEVFLFSYLACILCVGSRETLQVNIVKINIELTNSFTSPLLWATADRQSQYPLLISFCSVLSKVVCRRIYAWTCVLVNLLELLKYRSSSLYSTDQFFCSGPMVKIPHLFFSVCFSDFPLWFFNAPSWIIPWLLILRYWNWFFIVFLASETPKRLW